MTSTLYYYGYRYYLPWLGRWLNPDPSGIAEGLNLFCMVRNNPITFYDSDGKKPTPTLNQTYPTKIHPASKMIYHPIKEVFGFIEPSEKREVDARVWEVEAQGQPIRLVTGPKLAKRVALNVHGNFINTEDIIHLTADMPIITVIGPHGENLKSKSTETNKTYAKISYEGITLNSEQAVNTFINEKEGYAKITGSHIEQSFQNIILEKMPTIPYDIRLKHYFEGLAYEVHLSRQTGNPLDFITVRKKARITARETIMEAITLGYKEIILNTCRGPVPTHAEVMLYHSDQTVVLDEPIFQTWKQIREWNEIQTFFT